MIRTYRLTDIGVRRAEGAEGAADAVWIDLFEPTADEKKAVEAAVRTYLPTREEMVEIESSSRLYEENGATYMTASILVRADTEQPESTAVTFALVDNRVITIRYADPQPFRIFANQVERRPQSCASGEVCFFGLLEAIVDRLADILERANLSVDGVSREVFFHNGGAQPRARDFQAALVKVGRIGDLTSKARESLVSIARLVAFFGHVPRKDPDRVTATHLRTMQADVSSLSDHATFLSNKVSFLLDAILGMLNIEQNAIIKIFSVAAVAFMPPTLIASIYGMNFHFMPELSSWLGYPLALLAMAVSALVPYLYFKRRGWL